MRILWIAPVGTDIRSRDVISILKSASRSGTQVDLATLPSGRPHHVEYHAYEELVTGDIVRRENIHAYGLDRRMVSMLPLELGVQDFQKDHDLTCNRMLAAGRKAVEEDGAEALILGCTAEYGFNRQMQEELGVPVIDAVTAPLKYAEMLAESAQCFGWYPSRKWGSEAPPQGEIEAWGLFKDAAPVGVHLSDKQNAL